MTNTEQFAVELLIVAAVGLVVVLSSSLTERLKIPSPAVVLVGAAVAVRIVPGLRAPQQVTVARIVTVALVCILFDGGLRIGAARFGSAAGAITVVGVVGTFLTAAAGTVLCHLAFGLGWYLSALVATAVAPTDPAVVFSVLGRREVSGLAGTILEGESGANDPVAIALMAGLVAAHGLGGTALLHVGGDLLLEMGVGAAVGLAGGWGLLVFVRRVALPSEALYPLRTLASVMVLFGVAALGHGSGFLAVFVAGIVLGDERAPYKREIERFHTALASLGEIVAFVVLGLTVDLGELSHTNVWLPGLALGVVLAVVIRPMLVGLCLLPARLEPRQRNFVLFAGLKGAVPILLAGDILTAHVPGSARLYGIVVVVVVFSVVVQGSLVPFVAGLLELPMGIVEPQPWALGVRLRNEPQGVHRLTVETGSPADGCLIDELGGLPGDAWITLLVRDGDLLPVRGSTRLRSGDEVTVLSGAHPQAEVASPFLRRPVA